MLEGENLGLNGQFGDVLTFLHFDKVLKERVMQYNENV